MECPRCHELASPAALVCAGCAAPLRLGEEPRPARLDRILDLDRRGPGRAAAGGGELAPLSGSDPARGEGEGVLGLELDRDLDPDPDRAPACEPVMAPLGRRAAAIALDGALVAAGTAPPILFAAWVIPGGADLTRALLTAALALGALLAVAYAALGHGLLGATLGDRLLGLAVTDRDGQSPGMGRAALRAAAALLGTLALGAGLWPAIFTPSRRAFHDRVAGTFVVRAP